MNFRSAFGFVLLFITFLLLIFYMSGTIGVEGGFAAFFTLGFFAGAHFVVWGFFFSQELRAPVGLLMLGAGGILLYPPFGGYPGEYGTLMTTVTAILLACGGGMLAWWYWDRRCLSSHKKNGAARYRHVWDEPPSPDPLPLNVRKNIR